MNNRLFNIEKLDDLAEGDKDFINEILGLFISNTPSELQRMKDAQKEGNHRLMGEIAHKLKPSIQLLGINSIEQEVIDLEECGLKNTNLEKVPALFEKINTVSLQAIDQIKTEYQL